MRPLKLQAKQHRDAAQIEILVPLQMREPELNLQSSNHFCTSHLISSQCRRSIRAIRDFCRYATHIPAVMHGGLIEVWRLASYLPLPDF